MNNIQDILAGSSINDMLLSPVQEVDDSKNTTENSPAQSEKEKSNTIDTEAILRMAHSIRSDVDALIRMITHGHKDHPPMPAMAGIHIENVGERVLEGVFNGYAFIGEDGKEYAVPPNYASKSKLVEGDMMKLTITRSGSFIYKQIGPTKRKTVVGELTYNADKREWSVLADGRPYKVLAASATFHRGVSGDKATLIVPESGESSWGAIDNILHAPKLSI